MTQYRAHDGHSELEVKRSRFIALGVVIASKADFERHLSQLQQQHNKASHVCWAFRCGTGNRPEEGYSDDGEPGGTAGMPMLNVLRHHNLVDYAVFVVRYFGGTKLGTGGLQRAYSGAVQQLIASLSLSAIVPTTQHQIELAFAQESGLRRELESHQAQVLDCQYRPDKVVMQVELPVHHEEALTHYCQLHQMQLSSAA
ncbi:hypothetical protein GCM10011297_12610 [Bacterioplanes sanyensis]|uniref:IMPACT family protein n=1 Tax=Bacterioplanes sanyensis TaxID=1249553 RepID=UPI00167AA282|nr:YigZ family protein [Bacterioplanes sanyensis]GGY41079.1 hypothetical protein GCM10011297_12610 [Bacterioplanes sanyensis]